MPKFYICFETEEADSRSADQTALEVRDLLHLNIAAVHQEVKIKSVDEVPVELQFALRKFDGQLDNEGQLVLYTGWYEQEDGSLKHNE